MSGRRKLIAGNWKMNGLHADGVALAAVEADELVHDAASDAHAVLGLLAHLREALGRQAVGLSEGADAVAIVHAPVPGRRPAISRISLIQLRNCARNNLLVIVIESCRRWTASGPSYVASNCASIHL